MNRLICSILLILSIVSCKSAKDRLIEEIKSGEKILFNDSLKTLNEVEANKVFLNYLKYAEVYKDDTLSATYLFKAGDLSNGLNRPAEAISVFEKLRKNFPEYQKAPAALFMEGFIYETRLADSEKAKEKYRLFIAQYPDHRLTPSAHASLDQLEANLSNEALIKMFEEKNKK